ncbi:hypothetical protein GXM_07630 [Nostoc sphaeroides CCNUC1]|uniref:Uncharacterized protein n=1 Tax=Nostoc sphaeroides CCNUC1 TaxID=2653204 RepID=A0A5P8WDB5_9NOSO|nr:hypothetical protein GXM_07630 [Nostoc sphaeroides CCNUC1]
MWFWSANSVEQELFDLYAPALQSLGVNFNDEQLQDTLEASSYSLEDAFRSAIVYILWLEENLKPIYPTAILIDALANQWRTKYWKPEYLELEQLLSRGKRLWKAAVYNCSLATLTDSITAPLSSSSASIMVYRSSTKPASTDSL